MERRELLTGLAASALLGLKGQAATVSNTFLELKTWRLHNSAEHQAERLADYLEHGLMPGLERAGAKLSGAFANVISPDGPYYITLTQYPSLAVMQDALAKLTEDQAHTHALQKLSAESGLPFVQMDTLK